MKTGTHAVHNGNAYEIDITCDRVYYLCPACEKGYALITDTAACCRASKKRVRDRARRHFPVQLDMTQL